MKKMYNAVAISIMLIISLATISSAQAGDYVIAICEIQMSKTANVAIKPCGSWSAKYGSNGGYIAFSGSSIAGQQMYRTALLGYTLNESVLVRITTGTYYDVVDMIRLR